jgi:hypothetical protein
LRSLRFLIPKVI